MGWESKKFMHDCNRVKLQKPLAGKAGKTKTFSPFAGDGSDSPDKQIYELNNETQITGDTIRLFGFSALVLEAGSSSGPLDRDSGGPEEAPGSVKAR